ncbi:MAG: nicotinate (nicotinamide) nucleotide adenylyltransferase [Myxococcota bacterium]
MSDAPAVVALFGGSFNPPHLAHQMVCLYVLETSAVDAVWMIPTYRHPFAKELIAFEHRYAMCQRACRGLGGRAEVSAIEAELDLPVSRTLDTVNALAERHPGTRFRLVIGADILAETDKWYRWDEVARLAPPLVVGRGGYGDGGAAIELPRISSTQVRAILARGESAVPLVSRSVMDYIAEQGLYR